MNLFKSTLSKQNAILNYCQEAVLIVSSNGEIIFANPSAEKVFSCESLISKSFTDLFSVNLDSILNSQNEKNILKIQTESQEEKIVEIKASKIGNEENFIVSVLDITKAHSIIQTLLNEQHNQEKINHQKNNLLVKIANNLTSPLHSIVGFSQAILEGLGGEINDKQEKYLSIIHKNSSELLFLLEQIVELSKIEANLYENDYKNFDVTATLANIANENRYLIEEKNLQLHINTEFLERQNCYGDENSIKYIISNLLKNAIMSCDLGSITINVSTPSIEILEEKNIRAFDEKSFVMIEVVDTGTGILSNEIEDLFDPYVQADKAVKKNLIKGLMLGISKKLAESLNGKLWVESEIMKGSKYSFIVPIEKTSQPNEETPAQDEEILTCCEGEID